MSLTFSPLLQVSAPRIKELSVSQRVGNHAEKPAFAPLWLPLPTTHFPVFLLLLASEVSECHCLLFLICIPEYQCHLPVNISFQAD